MNVARLLSTPSLPNFASRGTIRCIPLLGYRHNDVLSCPVWGSQKRFYLRHARVEGIGMEMGMRMRIDMSSFGGHKGCPMAGRGMQSQVIFCGLSSSSCRRHYRLSFGKSKEEEEGFRFGTAAKIGFLMAFCAILDYFFHDILHDTFDYMLFGLTPRPHPVFDSPRFVPFTLVQREQVSETAVVLTLRPQRKTNKGDKGREYEAQWKEGTWSVEFKQPELMIAREYTPLPPLPQPKAGEEADLQFLIRKERGGEMSGYLFSLSEGDILNLRGPKEEFAFEGMGDVREVVFLAGGTGIASALQVAYVVLEGTLRTPAPDKTPKSPQGNVMKGLGSGVLEKLEEKENKPRVRILWANRMTEDRRQSGPVFDTITSLKARHGDHFEISYLVDEERTFVDEKVIKKAIGVKNLVKPVDIEEEQKRFLIMVSGPQGFVEYVAGAKVWEGGKECQGAVGGLLGYMGVLGKGWGVWKL